MNCGSILKGILLAFALAVSACQQATVTSTAKAENHPIESSSAGGFGSAIRLGSLEDSGVRESSGIVASRTTPGLYWTHNDSGDGPFLYAFDNRGARRGTWRVSGAGARDWEDVAAGPGPKQGASYLYIGDIGDNRGLRKEVVVYRVPEPTILPADVNSRRSTPRTTEAAETIRLRYPDGSHDAEALLVHPATGDIYLITKITFGSPAIYKAVSPHNTARTTTLARIGTLETPGLFGGMITGGDISPDGRRVALCDYVQGYEIVLPRGANFDRIWKQPLTIVALGERRQGEAIGYRLDGKALLATSEGRPAPLIQVERP